jgi:hypothetical protein
MHLDVPLCPRCGSQDRITRFAARLNVTCAAVALWLPSSGNSAGADVMTMDCTSVAASHNASHTELELVHVERHCRCLTELTAEHWYYMDVLLKQARTACMLPTTG